MTADNQKGRNIMINTGKSRRIAPSADSNKLMQQNHTTKPYARPNPAVPAYLYIVAHNNIVFEYAVMSDVCADH